MTREIFGLGPYNYKHCNVLLEDHIKEGYILVQDPETKHEYVAKTGLGTWCVITPYDSLYQLMRNEKRIKELETSLARIKNLLYQAAKELNISPLISKE